MTAHAPQSTQSRSGAVETSGRPSRWRRRRPALAAAGVVAVAGIVIGVTNPFGGGTTPGGGVAGNSYPTSIAHVRQGTLSAQITGVGALGYAAQPDGSPYAVVNRAGGTI